MFENITVTGSPLVLSTDAEVDQAQAVLGTRFPTGYREYVTQFGEGILGGVYVRIYRPINCCTAKTARPSGLSASTSTGSGTTTRS